MIEVRYDHGVYLPVYDLWLDPWEAKRFSFVSPAHRDHIAPHEEIILSERTARLLQRRTATRARYRSTATAGGTHFWLSPIISLKSRGDAALHRRLQIASREIGRSS